MSRHSGRKPGDGNMAGAVGGYGTESRDGRAQEYALRIMEALSGVDEELLDRCSCAETDADSRKAPSSADVPEVRDGRGARRLKRRRPIWQTAGAWAAAICLVAVGAAGWKGYWMLRENGSDGVSGGSTYQAESAYERNGAGVPGGEPETGADGCVPEDASNGMGTAAEGAGAAPNSADAGAADEKLAQNKEQQEAGGKQQGGNENGLKQSGGEFEAVSNGIGTAEGGRQEAASGEGAPGCDSGEGGIPEGSDMEAGCIRMNAKDYTEQEIRRLDGLGIYVPETLPEGYGFTRAYSNPDLDRENLTVCWSRGMDSIMLHLEMTDGTVKTVDVKKPETYDERLYEIPYGETVPGEYRQTFSNPVFALEDFSLESVKSRMLVYEDGGDTAMPRGNFGVLYPDGVLASFSGRGTAEEIWDMFSSMGN